MSTSDTISSVSLVTGAGEAALGVCTESIVSQVEHSIISVQFRGVESINVTIMGKLKDY